MGHGMKSNEDCDQCLEGAGFLAVAVREWASVYCSHKSVPGISSANKRFNVQLRNVSVVRRQILATVIGCVRLNAIEISE